MKPKLQEYSNHYSDLSRDIKAIRIPASYTCWTARPVDNRVMPSARIVKRWYRSPFPIAMLHSSRALGGSERLGKLMAGVENVDWLPSLDNVERRANKAPRFLLSAVRRTLQEKVRYYWRRTLHPISRS